MSRENLPARRSMTPSRPRVPGFMVVAPRKVAFPVVGDPDGSKARAAGARGRSTKSLDPIDQAWNYVEQNGTNRHTPKQRRRLEKKLHRQGLLAKRSGGKTSKTLTGLATRRAVLDEVTA